MAAILVYSEQADTALELVGAARGLAPQLGLTVSAAVLGAEAAGTAAAAAALAAHGAAPVYVCTEPALEGLDTAVVTRRSPTSSSRLARASYCWVPHAVGASSAAAWLSVWGPAV